MDVVQRVLGAQLLVAVAGAGAVWVFLGKAASVAVAYGCICALANAALLFVRMRSDWRRQGDDARRHLRFFFRSSFERFAVVVSLLVVGLVGLGFSPLHVIAGFVAGQAVFLAASIGIHERE
ncbi:ATP synthase subunit I [Rhodocyclus tenuis]|uniref:ATP synthase subunit I n=1 Tax=Rhodocyclus tenuis TaxID=1066 RepID=UPI0019080672|nr:ATP synthase subunit I [Rhodocyclus tenuis]MBK1681497.1 hypothetical protein [Rhodocyclus tenuis]